MTEHEVLLLPIYNITIINILPRGPMIAIKKQLKYQKSSKTMTKAKHCKNIYLVPAILVLM